MCVCFCAFLCESVCACVCGCMHACVPLCVLFAIPHYRSLIGIRSAFVCLCVCAYVCVCVCVQKHGNIESHIATVTQRGKAQSKDVDENRKPAASHPIFKVN